MGENWGYTLSSKLAKPVTQVPDLPLERLPPFIAQRISLSKRHAGRVLTWRAKDFNGQFYIHEVREERLGLAAFGWWLKQTHSTRQ